MTSTQQTNVETAKISQETLSPSKNENENEQSDAFNPETGEINWDCPCLGGMAKGSCGEQFKAAFSCFIYSKAEPKGVDCLEQFQKMKDCFREHPDEYGDELDDDDDDTEEEANLVTEDAKKIDLVTEDAKNTDVSKITAASTTETSNTFNHSDTSDKQKYEKSEKSKN
ncbi:uncharacterized protein OCT59_024529 [Rhizophagus irregularis]|uniref:Mitochondrial intermembrane space import and assembly protein 40 n=1 Tax=Rhizophagus irregularis TaxID=588596 RepID=A0A2N1NQ98_9GLOM|nr:hypothetical protein RhiirC2_735130 [Rhizophagus irregularis]UZO04135.1 hypothetical protein OCT59_024529 [Rhizophagus irregularis]GBC14348.1 mitochondrial intermembrane space import and assembly protein 40 [Rhizophagus irregularis DAOM 181602=DAOM 197198]CAB4395863.1 unnamed protein product [Rhizophagus irregularis]CAB5302150.1 unnamed protein product [Rhizophagus irregularis]